MHSVWSLHPVAGSETQQPTCRTRSGERPQLTASKEAGQQSANPKELNLTNTPNEQDTDSPLEPPPGS